ncbi:MAG: hypothetical protein CMC96_08905 [Flavobacteriales bacterium]|nr:hypothetical protein [Flavobacteriales bacterium]
MVCSFIVDKLHHYKLLIICCAIYKLKSTVNSFFNCFATNLFNLFLVRKKSKFIVTTLKFEIHNFIFLKALIKQYL